MRYENPGLASLNSISLTKHHILMSGHCKSLKSTKKKVVFNRSPGKFNIGLASTRNFGKTCSRINIGKQSVFSW